MEPINLEELKAILEKESLLEIENLYAAIMKEIRQSEHDAMLVDGENNGENNGENKSGDGTKSGLQIHSDPTKNHKFNDTETDSIASHKTITIMRPHKESARGLEPNLRSKKQQEKEQ